MFWGIFHKKIPGFLVFLLTVRCKRRRIISLLVVLREAFGDERMCFYRLGSAKFHEKVSVRTVCTVNPIRNSTTRDDGVQKKQISNGMKC